VSERTQKEPLTALFLLFTAAIKFKSCDFESYRNHYIYWL